MMIFVQDIYVMLPWNTIAIIDGAGKICACVPDIIKNICHVWLNSNKAFQRNVRFRKCR